MRLLKLWWLEYVVGCVCLRLNVLIVIRLVGFVLRILINRVRCHCLLRNRLVMKVRV